MSQVSTACQACSRHLGPSMGKNKSLFLDKHHNRGLASCKRLLEFFLIFLPFVHHGENPSCQVTFLALWVFFRHSQSISLWNLWVLGFWKSPKDLKVICAFCPITSFPELLLWFKGKGKERGKRKFKEEKFRWTNISKWLISQNTTPQLRGGKMTTS